MLAEILRALSSKRIYSVKVDATATVTSSKAPGQRQVLVQRGPVHSRGSYAAIHKPNSTKMLVQGGILRGLHCGAAACMQTGHIRIAAARAKGGRTPMDPIAPNCKQSFMDATAPRCLCKQACGKACMAGRQHAY
eukprot:155535-Pelagomonas_calceolata.AAC.1